MCTQDRRAESHGDRELCWWWHSASPAEAGTAHGCVWAAGEVGDGDTSPCRTLELAQPLFPSVSSVDGGSGSACPWFADVTKRLQRTLAPAVKLLGN